MTSTTTTGQFDKVDQFLQDIASDKAALDGIWKSAVRTSIDVAGVPMLIAGGLALTYGGVALTSGTDAMYNMMAPLSHTMVIALPILIAAVSVLLGSAMFNIALLDKDINKENYWDINKRLEDNNKLFESCHGLLVFDSVNKPELIISSENRDKLLNKIAGTQASIQIG